MEKLSEIWNAKSIIYIGESSELKTFESDHLPIKKSKFCISILN